MPKGFKTGGRTKGVLNKRRNIVEICESISFDPFEAMARIAADPEHPRSFEAIKELCQYLEPKKKAVELNANINSRLVEEAEAMLDLSKEDLLQIVEEETKRLK